MAKIRVIHKVGEKIPTSKIRNSMAGKYGSKGKQQAQFMKNVLIGHG